MSTDLCRSLNSGSRTGHAVRILTDLFATGGLASGESLPAEPVPLHSSVGRPPIERPPQ
jgi:hypothetical protein